MSYNYKRVVKKFLPKSVLLLGLFFAASFCFGQLPTHSLALWLRADSGVVATGGVVSQWNDVSGHNNNASAPVGSQPTLIADVPLLNNKPSVKFNGYTQFLSGLPITSLNNNSSLCGENIFVVCKADSGGTAHNGVFTIGANLTGMWLERFTGYAPIDFLFINDISANQGAAYAGFSGMPNSAFPYRLFEVRKVEGVSVKLDTNSVQPPATGNQVPQILEAANGGPQMCGPFINDTFRLGFAPGLAGNDGYFNGEIAEVLIYDTCLTSTQIQQVEAYLYNKYAPAANLGPNIVVTNTLCTVPISPGNNYKKYHWSNGSSADTIFVSAGTYSVTTTDVFNFSSTSTITVSYADSLPHTASACQGGSVTLTPYLASISGPTFSWSNGLTTSTISPTTAGNYTLTVTDVNHCSIALGPETVTVDNFASTVSLGGAASYCSGNQITLTSPSSGWGTMTFSWSNGSVNSFTNVNTTGPYSVTVTDAGGCSGSASVNITIIGVAPFVNFSHDTICQGVAFAPTNLSQGNNVTYAWAFGDGGTSTLSSPTHTFSVPGTYQVTLTGSSGVCAKDTVLPVVVNVLPSAAFQTGVACTGNPVFTFQDLSSPVPGQTITSWSWNFGDPLNGTSTMQNPTYTYTSQPDTYVVTLTVVQGNGCMSTVSNNFIVEVPPANPTPPLLVFPPNNSVASTTTVTFGWQAEPGDAYYQLLISTDSGLHTSDIFYNNLYTNQKTVTVAANQTYYWQVTAYNACGLPPAPSVIYSFRQLVPSNLLPSNLALWLEANNGVTANGNGAVSQWSDESGNNYNATAAGNGMPSVIPTVPLLNHRPSLLFNGTGNYMTGPIINGLNTNSLSIFIVARADGTQNVNGDNDAGIFTVGDVNCGMFVERDGTNGFQVVNDIHCNGDVAYGNPPHDRNSMPPGVACPYHIYGYVKSLGVSVIIDTNSIFSAPPSAPHVEDFSPFSNNAPYYLGWMNGPDPYSGNIPYAYLNGEIAEIIIYNAALDVSQQTLVNNYLFDKYAPPVNLGPDIVQNYRLCPVTLQTGNRFKSYLWSDGSTADTLLVTIGGKYWVQTLDVFNRYSSDTINVTLPYTGAKPNPDYICHGDTGQISQVITDPSGYNYIWYYNATSSSPDSNLNINADTIYPHIAGFYHTKISDNTGCSLVTSKVPLIIDTFYNVSLLSAYDTICKDGTLLINVVPYTIDTFLWSPMAYPADTVSAPTISASGEYHLYAVDNHGCKRYDSTMVTTRAEAPVVDFTVPNVCLANTTYFVNQSHAATGDSIIANYWNYGGGIPAMDTDSVLTNGQTSYTINYGYGSYTVTLTVITDSGCFGVKTEHVNILPSPHAEFSDAANNSVYPYILCAGAGSSLQLTDISTEVGGSPITQRFWKFNGVTDANHGSNVQYSFPNQGTYNITLEVVDSLGCADSITQTINVSAPFVARFSVDDHCLGDYTSFVDLTQSLSIVKRTWNFRDGGEGPYAYTPTVQYKYSQPNTYQVELQDQNAIGCIATFDTFVKIVPKPVANFTGLIGCENHYYKPIDSSFTINDTIDHWHWDIGGRISNLKGPRVMFTDTGAFYVSLTVSTEMGCVDSITKLIEVGPVPTAMFVYTPLYGTAPLPVTFTNRSTGATNYVWNFGDGSSSTIAYPQINPAPHTYTENGVFNVELYAYNNYGCYDSLTRMVDVIPTDLCLTVDQVTATAVAQPDGSELVTVLVYITNLGTRIITSADFYATLGSTNILEQNWSGYLPSGGTIADTFPAQFVVPAGATNNYVCVTVTNVNGGETEANCGNNQECFSLTGTMQLAGPSPSPAGSTCQLGIILPKAGTVYITVYDVLGQPAIPEFSLSLPAERSNYNIPVTQLASGEYFIRVRYNDDSQVRKFVVR